MSENHLDAEQVARNLSIALSKIQGRLRREAGTVDRGITASQMAMLQHLAQTGGLSVSSLAAHENVTQQAITQRLEMLAPTGLVDIRPDASDGRKKLVTITCTGRRFLSNASSHEETWLLHAMDANLAEKDMAVLCSAAELIDRLASWSGTEEC